MTDIRSMYSKAYIGSWDLPEDRDAIVRIVRVEAGQISNGTKTDKKPLVFLEGSKGPLEKPMVLNATNMKSIAGMYGYKVEAWVGRPIALYKTQVQAVGGGVTDAIRVRPTPPKVEAAKGRTEVAS